MEKVHTLRALAIELGLNYHTMRRWCRLNLIEYARTPTGTLCLTDSQVRKMLNQMVGNGNGKQDAGAATSSR